jgi:hypothetical protein
VSPATINTACKTEQAAQFCLDDANKERDDATERRRLLFLAAHGAVGIMSVYPESALENGGWSGGNR